LWDDLDYEAAFVGDEHELFYSKIKRIVKCNFYNPFFIFAFIIYA
jgi:hypothetical protein